MKFPLKKRSFLQFLKDHIQSSDEYRLLKRILADDGLSTRDNLIDWIENNVNTGTKTAAKFLTDTVHSARASLGQDEREKAKRETAQQFFQRFEFELNLGQYHPTTEVTKVHFQPSLGKGWKGYCLLYRKSSFDEWAVLEKKRFVDEEPDRCVVEAAPFFVGRKLQLEKAKAALKVPDTWIVITGGLGFGKTFLAEKIIRQAGLIENYVRVNVENVKGMFSDGLQIEIARKASALKDKLVSGAIPYILIFIDGMNELYNPIILPRGICDKVQVLITTELANYPPMKTSRVVPLEVREFSLDETRCLAVAYGGLDFLNGTDDDITALHGDILDGMPAATDMAFAYAREKGSLTATVQELRKKRAALLSLSKGNVSITDIIRQVFLKSNDVIEEQILYAAATCEPKAFSPILLRNILKNTSNHILIDKVDAVLRLWCKRSVIRFHNNNYVVDSSNPLDGKRRYPVYYMNRLVSLCIAHEQKATCFGRAHVEYWLSVLNDLAITDTENLFSVILGDDTTSHLSIDAPSISKSIECYAELVQLSIDHTLAEIANRMINAIQFTFNPSDMYALYFALDDSIAAQICKLLFARYRRRGRANLDATAKTNISTGIMLVSLYGEREEGTIRSLVASFGPTPNVRHLAYKSDDPHLVAALCYACSSDDYNAGDRYELALRLCEGIYAEEIVSTRSIRDKWAKNLVNERFVRNNEASFLRLLVIIHTLDIPLPDYFTSNYIALSLRNLNKESQLSSLKRRKQRTRVKSFDIPELPGAIFRDNGENYLTILEQYVQKLMDRSPNNYLVGLVYAVAILKYAAIDANPTLSLRIIMTRGSLALTRKSRNDLIIVLETVKEIRRALGSSIDSLCVEEGTIGDIFKRLEAAVPDYDPKIDKRVFVSHGTTKLAT